METGRTGFLRNQVLEEVPRRPTANAIKVREAFTAYFYNNM